MQELLRLVLVHIKYRCKDCAAQTASAPSCPERRMLPKETAAGCIRSILHIDTLSDHATPHSCAPTTILQRVKAPPLFDSDGLRWWLFGSSTTASMSLHKSPSQSIALHSLWDRGMTRTVTADSSCSGTNTVCVETAESCAMHASSEHWG